MSCCAYQILWTVTNHIRNITDYTTAIICINLRFCRPSGVSLYAAGRYDGNMSAREFLSITVVFLAITCLLLHVQLGADAGKSRKKVRT